MTPDDLPSSDSPTVLASVVGGLVMFARSMGITLDDIQRSSGLGPDDWADPDARVPYSNGISIWRLLEQRFPDRAIGLEHAEWIPESAFGTVIYACRNARTVREAIETMIRYQGVMSSHITITLERSVFRVRHLPELRSLRSLMESSLASFWRYVRELTKGEAALQRVELEHAAPKDPSSYVECFGCEIYFDCDRSALTLDPATLARPVLHARPALFRVIQEHLEAAHAEVLAMRRGDPELVVKVRNVVAELGRERDYGAQSVADAMSMPLRSLQRALREHGPTLTELIDEVRRAHAQRMLRDRSMTIDDVAFLVGYAEERSFNRAFKRWTGQTPAQFRRG